MATSPAAPTASAPLDDFAQALLAVAPTGLLVLRPVYDAAGPAIVDFTYEHLNPVAQQLLRLPERPAESLLTLEPAARKTDVLAFYAAAFASGQTARQNINYQHDEQDGAYQLVARRSGERLVVSLTAASEQPRPAMEAALREAQQTNAELEARVQERTQQLDRQRAAQQRLFRQAPMALVVLRGPEFIIEQANERAEVIWGVSEAEVLGRPHFEAIPGSAGQGFEELLTGVLHSGTPLVLQEVPIELERAHTGRPNTGYYSIVFQPLRDEHAQVSGIAVIWGEVTDQVLARQQVQTLNEELAAINEELRAANDEYQHANTSLHDAQQQLRQLNQELEARVQERTQQLQAAQAATERERALLQAMFAQAPVAIALFRGEDVRVASANEQMAALWGRTSAQVVGRTLLEAAPELTGQGFDDIIREVLTTHVPYVGLESAATVLVEGQLRVRYYNFSVQPIYDAQAQLLGAINVAVEVTEQVGARQQLRQLNQELEARVQQRTQELAAATRRVAEERENFYQILEQTPAAILILRGPEHRFDYFNVAYQRIQPGPEPPQRGRRAAEVLPEVEAQGYVALLDQVYHTGQAHQGYEAPIHMARPGSPAETHYYNFSYSPYREGGHIVGVSVFAYDVTEIVLARRQQEGQRQLLESVFAQAPMAVYVMRMPDYTLDVVNPRMAELMGQPAAELVGRPMFEAIPEVRNQGVEELLAQVWETTQPVYVRELPARLRYHGPGEMGYFNFVYQPILDADEQMLAMVCAAQEITEQVRARQQVQTLNEELAAINEELAATNEELHASNTSLTRTNVDLDNFVYTASHDLKTPISNIEGLLRLLGELLPETVRQDEIMQPVLSRMQESVERFKRTIGHLTDVSKLQAEFAQPAEVVALAAVIEDVRQDLWPQFTEAQAQLEVSSPGCRPRVFSPKNLRSVVYNLLSNALKYRHPDRPAWVRISCQPAGPNLVLTVQDNGLGLSEQQQTRLFQLFQRLHTHVEGTGVGLYAVKKIVENAGGTITVVSQEGSGTTFTLTFPA